MSSHWLTTIDTKLTPIPQNARNFSQFSYTEAHEAAFREGCLWAILVRRI